MQTPTNLMILALVVATAACGGDDGPGSAAGGSGGNAGGTGGTTLSAGSGGSGGTVPSAGSGGAVPSAGFGGSAPYAGSGGSPAGAGSEAGAGDECAATGESCLDQNCCYDQCIEEICGGPEMAPGRCIVGGQIYTDGASNVPDPFSCNTCTCQDGEITGCTEMACPNPPGPVGTRCRDDADCLSGLTCYKQLAGERPVCTATCDSTTGGVSCPPESECVHGLPYFDGGIAGNFCMVPCLEIADCGELNSECDDPGDMRSKYCF